jgi:threonine dehydrogenase-like Zn-dependent dehydrogenase
MKPLITHKYNLDEIEEGFTAAKTKPDGFVKAVITID